MMNLAMIIINFQIFYRNKKLNKNKEPLLCKEKL